MNLKKEEGQREKRRRRKTHRRKIKLTLCLCGFTNILLEENKLGISSIPSAT
jgi:hypothetical protein